MNCADERGKSRSGESKKSVLLPTGEKAKAIIEVLAAMFQDTRNPEDPANTDAREKDACPDNEGQEQSG